MHEQKDVPNSYSEEAVEAQQQEVETVEYII